MRGRLFFEGPHDAPLEHSSQDGHGRRHQEDGDPEVQAKRRYEQVGTDCSHHVELAVGHVYDAHLAEDEGKAESDQAHHASPDQPIEELEDHGVDVYTHPFGSLLV